jgi:Cdc6-like AAA superfamily ATPase
LRLRVRSRSSTIPASSATSPGGSGGAPGTGKTLLCHCLLERLLDVNAAFLTNTHVGSRIGLLQALLFDLSLRKTPHNGPIPRYY